MLYILQASRSVPLLKLDEEARHEAEQRGEDLKLRAVEPPSFFLKIALQCITGNEAFKKKAREHFEPLQQCVGTPHGPARIANLLKAQVQAGASILEWDFENAFPTLSRQETLDRMLEHFPEYYVLTYNLLGYKSPVVVSRGGATSTIIHNSSGSAIGLPLSSFYFALGSHSVNTAIAQIQDTAVVRAFADDGYLSSTDFTPELFTQSLTTLKERARALGMTVNFEKSKFLLHPDNEHAEELTRLAAIEGIPVTQRGIKAIGIPVYLDSHPEYAREVCNKVLNRLVRKMEALVGLNAQSLLLMLKNCVNTAFMFLLQTVDPSVTRPFAQQLDAAIERILIQHVLQLSEEELRVSGQVERRARVVRALRWMRLPLRMGGDGLTSMEDVAPAAYFSSMVSAMARESRLEEHYAEYEDTLAGAYQTIMEHLSGLDTNYLPVNVNEIDTFYSNKEKTLQLQRKISNGYAKIRRSQLESEFHDSADVVAFAAGEHGPFAPLAAIPSNGHRTFSDPIFVTSVRAKLQLPRKPQRDAVERADIDCLVEECLACHGKVLDAHSNHAQSCPLARTARTSRHRGVNEVVCRYAKKAGYTVDREVQASELLAQNASPEDIAALVRVSRDRLDQRRMDAVLKDTIRGEEIWVDVTVRHPQCEHYLERERRQPGVAIREAVALKHRTYDDLVRAAQQEAEDHLRRCSPSFYVAAMTTLGQLGDRFEMLIETIVHHRELTLADEGPRMDGKSPFQVILEFRQNFKADLIFAMARGNAQMINRAGRARSFLRGQWRRD